MENPTNKNQNDENHAKSNLASWNSADFSNVLVIGVIRGSHGLTGKVKVQSTSGECEHFYKLKEVTLRKDGIEKNYTVESVDGCVSNLLIKFKEISTPEDAKKHNMWEIVVPREKASPLKKDEFYVDDLTKCMLFYNDKSSANPIVEVGCITDVLEGGAGSLIEVALSESFDFSAFGLNEVVANNRKRIIPFRKEFIGTVDLKSRKVELMHLWILE
ncbi:MAG: ribosome maturation factor RimM [Treponemataceae bacterium]